MYIYIIFQRERYENDLYIGSFSTREKAEEYLRQDSDGFNFIYYIEKVKLDKTK